MFIVKVTLKSGIQKFFSIEKVVNIKRVFRKIESFVKGVLNTTATKISIGYRSGLVKWTWSSVTQKILEFNERRVVTVVA
jgi:hypothetical protein